MKPFSVYLHIPFCSHKCPYCDFNTYAVTTVPEKAYTAALLAELDYRASLPEWQGRTVQTIFFGGGTPSLFSERAIAQIINRVKSTFPTNEDMEVTLEANPGTFASDYLVGLRKAGVNRLSIGAQSFQPTLLAKLGRIHSPEQTLASIAAAQDVEFKSVSADIMFGVPHQSISDLRRDVQTLIQSGANHVSAYGLTIEKGTPFYVSHKKGLLPVPSEDAVVEMMTELEALLRDAEYGRYEISNFCQPGHEARHNMAYWNGDDYLGLGAGAHSFYSFDTSERTEARCGRRWSNLALPKSYMDKVSTTGCAEGWQDILSMKASMFEFFFLGLRKIEGVRLADFESKYGLSPYRAYPRILELLTEERLLKVKGGMLSLTERGLLLADSVIENFAHPEVTSAKPIEEVYAANY